MNDLDNESWIFVKENNVNDAAEGDSPLSDTVHDTQHTNSEEKSSDSDDQLGTDSDSASKDSTAQKKHRKRKKRVGKRQRMAVRARKNKMSKEHDFSITKSFGMTKKTSPCTLSQGIALVNDPKQKKEQKTMAQNEETLLNTHPRFAEHNAFVARLFDNEEINLTSALLAEFEKTYISQGERAQPCEKKIKISSFHVTEPRVSKLDSSIKNFVDKRVTFSMAKNTMHWLIQELLTLVFDEIL